MIQDSISICDVIITKEVLLINLGFKRRKIQYNDEKNRKGNS
jgi:hypothetical protein